MTATISSEIQSLSPTALVELFTLDYTNLPSGSVLNFYSGVSLNLGMVVWQGVTYTPLPIEATGFDLSAKGSLPRPKFSIANKDGALSALVVAQDDLIGCKIVRRRTFLRFMDAVNFPGGVNAEADPNQHYADDVWFVDRKMSESRYVIEWELASAFDLQGVQLPYRQVIQNSCQWRYRSSECSYTGGYIDKDNVVTAVPANDFCSKTLAACRARFAVGTALPYGGFPGAIRYG